MGDASFPGDRRANEAAWRQRWEAKIESRFAEFSTELYQMRRDVLDIKTRETEERAIEMARTQLKEENKQWWVHVGQITTIFTAIIGSVFVIVQIMSNTSG